MLFKRTGSAFDSVLTAIPFVGRLFNLDGNLANWWTNRSIAAFKNKTKCLEDQYSNYKFHSMNVSMLSSNNKIPSYS